MSETSKKLTVAFGTFSCTLQGFDDPFPIMKRVVDYFQSLAAADPTFGSEPQRPDADQLRSFAEENTGGTVEAEMVGDELILSQPASAPASFDPPVVEPVIAPEDNQSNAEDADIPAVEETPLAVSDVVEDMQSIEETQPDQVWLAAQNWTAPDPAQIPTETIAQNEEDAAIKAALAAHTAAVLADMAATAETPAPFETAVVDPLDLSDFNIADAQFFAQCGRR